MVVPVYNVTMLRVALDAHNVPQTCLNDLNDLKERYEVFVIVPIASL